VALPEPLLEVRRELHAPHSVGSQEWGRQLKVQPRGESVTPESEVSYLQ